MQSNNNASSLKSFTVLEKLGEGSFASVYKVQRIDDQRLYAMKKVKIGQMKERERDNALNEVRVLASISHQNIVNYKEAFFDDTTQSLCIVMELADAGDIQKKINNHIKNHSHFTEAQIWQALTQMSRGLKAFHQINILHRDLKCANVFCTKDNKYKLGDLNVSKVAKRGMARTQTGTPYYTSPEVWKDRPYDSKCDIWSLGCVVYEMAALQPPFRANNLKELYTKIQRGIFQRIPSFYSEDLSEIINLCLKVNPNFRPSAHQILEHPKVLKNMPSSQRYALEEAQTKKSNLINTILCPRNLKSLKMALPGAKYEDSPKKEIIQPQRSRSVDMSRNLKKENSVKNIERPVMEIPRVINSPKVGEIGGREIKYALMRKPSSERHILPYIYKKQANSELRNKEYSRPQSKNNNSRMSRNNSVDSIRRRKDSVSSIQQRNNSKIEAQEAEKPRPQSNRSIENNSRMRRNLSNQSIESNGRRRQDSNRSIQGNNNPRQRLNSNRSNRSNDGKERQNTNRSDASRDNQDKSVERAKNAKAFMEDISNQVKNIQERVRLARMGMNNRVREEVRPQKPSDSYQKRYNLPQPGHGRKDSSVRSRNNSVELKPSNIPVYRPNSRGQPERSLSRNRSIERMERQNSQKAINPYPYRK